MPTAYRLFVTDATIVLGGRVYRVTKPMRKSVLLDMGAASLDGKYYNILPCHPRRSPTWYIIRFGRNYNSRGRVKVSNRPDKIDRHNPVVATISAHKRHARRTGRRIAKQYLAREIFADVEGDWNANFLPGLNSWDVS